MKDERLLSCLIVFCHRNSIVSQWQKSAKILGLRLSNIDASPDQELFSSNSDGWVLTYQSAARRLPTLKQELKKISSAKLLTIADEVHHLGVNPNEPDSPAWGKTFLEVTKDSALRLGLTGTPFRADNLSFCSAKKVRIQAHGEFIEQITPDLCIEPRELIAAGDVRPLEFHFQDGLIEHCHQGTPESETSPLSSEERESWRARNLRRAIKLSDKSSIAVQLILRATKKLKKIRSHHKNAAGLVIARDIPHANSIANFLKENGDKVELVHSQDAEASARLAAFQKGKALWLVSVDMCSEGFDASRLRVIAYLTTVVTRSRFLQSITRTVRISSERSCTESIPREPSYVFAPADPLLMEYARNWSSEKPYLIKSNSSVTTIGTASCLASRPALPMEAVNDKAGEVIKMRAAELPNFLKG